MFFYRVLIFFNLLKGSFLESDFFTFLWDTEEVTEQVFYWGVEEGILYA